MVTSYPGFVVAAYTGNLQYVLTAQKMSLGSGNEAKYGFPFMNNKHHFYININVIKEIKANYFSFSTQNF